MIITKRGKPIGRIVPLSQPTEAKIEALNLAGLISRSGEGLPPMAPVAQGKGDRTVADLLLESRE